MSLNREVSLIENKHTFVRNGGDGSYVIFCTRCGAEYRPKLPCVVSIFLGIMEEFIKIHVECQEKSEEVTDAEARN